MGTWYVIGRVPNFIERGHVASVNDYELRDEHKVGITYRYRDGFGEPLQEVRARASVDPDSGNHGWRTWFYLVVPTHSRVLEVAPDYSWALIGYPGREMAWIFSRTPDMDKALYKELAERLRDEYGVNTDKLKRVPQHRSRSGSWVTKYRTCVDRTWDCRPAAGTTERDAGRRPAFCYLRL